ncbi:MAG: glycosyltransferase [Chloroflexaceae bacterium]|jgi:hypothetical protein|nr:glycosyltransferase [Chloroflexaceae bacterium]
MAVLKPPIANHQSLIANLAALWQQATGGDEAARATWQTVEGGGWGWGTAGPSVNSSDEWNALAWNACGPATLHALGSFRVTLTVAGSARAAGLSFGPYKDFLVALPDERPRQLALEVDDTGGWRFTVDGQPQPPAWWNRQLHTVDDLLSGTLSFKTQAASHVHFRDLWLEPLATACELSVIITCNRFAQRLRLALRNWCMQELPFGSLELLVANPASPDGTHELLASVARTYPHMPVREVALPPELALNKGAMLNRAVSRCRGRWLWFTDADCLFAPGSAALALNYIRQRGMRLFYAERVHLDATQTDGLLAGRFDSIGDLPALACAAAQHQRDDAPWGYTQIVPRAALPRQPYPEQMNHFAHSDGAFVERCRRQGLLPERIPQLRCLHMAHPFAWYGTEVFL